MKTAPTMLNLQNRSERRSTLLWWQWQEPKATARKLFQVHTKRIFGKGDKQGKHNTVQLNPMEGHRKMFIGGSIIPVFYELVAAESNNKGYCRISYMPSIKTKLKLIWRIMLIMMHIISQTRASIGSIFCVTTSLLLMWLWKRSSACNIRQCNWTLVLKIQAGMCRIDQIADLPKVDRMLVGYCLISAHEDIERL